MLWRLPDCPWLVLWFVVLYSRYGGELEGIHIWHLQLMLCGVMIVIVCVS
jgi:hypothetical protein